METHLVFTEGDWIGQPFRLLDWQKRLLLELFELFPDGSRRFRTAYISVPKKNGKTEMGAALALYLLIGDGESSPKGVCAASSDYQADLAFGAASTMCRLSPTLSRITERYESVILVPSIEGAKLERVAAVAGANDGKNLHFGVLDEVHEWTSPKSRSVHTIITNAGAARAQPLFVNITTAGYDKETVCGELYEHSLAVLEARARGDEIDPSFYAYIVEAPVDANYRDRAVWTAANPSADVTVRWAFYESEINRKPENVCRRYYLNMWTESEESWLPTGAWLDCKDETYAAGFEPSGLPRGLDPALPVHVSIDAARTHDSSAVVVTQVRDGRFVQRAKLWANPYATDHAQHDVWRLDLAVIENYLLDVFEAFPVSAGQQPDAKPNDPGAPGPAFYYDPWRFDRSAELLAGKGLNMIEVPQTDARMAPACMAYYDLIAQKVIAHDGDPVFARHIAAAVRKDVSDRAWRLTKPRGSRKKIDAAVAGAIGAYHAMAQPAAPFRSAYESEGLTFSGAR